MEQVGVEPVLELLGSPGAAMQAAEATSTPHPPSLDAVQPLAGWGVEADENTESMVWFHQTPMTVDWAHPVATTTPNPLVPTVVAGSDLSASNCWLQLSSLEPGSTVIDSFKPKLFDPVLWHPSTTAASASEYITDGSPLPSNDPASYPLTPLESDLTDTIAWTKWQRNEPVELFEYQRPSMGEYDLGCRKRRRVQSHPSTDQGRVCKPTTRRPLALAQHLDSEVPRYAPQPIFRRDSTISLATSVTAPTFDTHGSDTTPTTPPSPQSDAPPQPGPPSPAKQRKKSTAQARNRNRAAASRYRAKTQAAYAQLEAEERHASERHQALLACVARLREEVFRLKTELLRHADCGCPLVRGYLSRAAEEAWAGRGGLGAGAVGS